MTKSFLAASIEVLKFFFNELNDNGFSREECSVEFNRNSDSILNILEYERVNSDG